MLFWVRSSDKASLSPELLGGRRGPLTQLSGGGGFQAEDTAGAEVPKLEWLREERPGGRHVRNGRTEAGAEPWTRAGRAYTLEGSGNVQTSVGRDGELLQGSERRRIMICLAFRDPSSCHVE